MKEILASIGLGFNFFGAILLAFPMLKFKKWLEDDFIIKSGTNSKGEFYYEKRGVKKIRCFALAGIVLLLLGFLLQLIDQQLK